MGDHAPRDRPVSFVQAGYQRHSLHRDRQHYLETCLKNDSALLLFVYDRKVALCKSDDGFVAALLDPSAIRRERRETLSAVFLGEYLDRPVFSITCDEHPRHLLSLGSPALMFFELRKATALLDPESASLLGYAMAMDHWHRNHRYCGVCGNPTEPSESGHMRTCTNRDCAQKHFPRTDPAVIVLVVDGEQSCLLGRKREWPDRRYSTIAGFVEPGETPEQAVIREVFEETGTTVRQPRYYQSQPWPFPGSLMLGFYATARRGEVHLFDNELQDARWFTREEIIDWVSTGRLRLPTRISIAYRLIESWFERADVPTLDSLNPDS
ncbi:MAG: NAD(+) diphosphatase [Proteobacteria bacterium]|nr:MAG: NAD(+) diphosphatase [Pseudomonadota bacterium]